MRSATPASRQARRAMEVHSSLTSKHVSVPPGASPRAMASDDMPVNVPTSTARSTWANDVRTVKKVAWSRPMLMPAIGPSASVRSVRLATTRSGVAVWART